MVSADMMISDLLGMGIKNLLHLQILWGGYPLTHVVGTGRGLA
jgi:hypothetical protein